MGGKKKRSLKQAEKAQRKKAAEERKKSAAEAITKKVLSINIPKMSSREILDEIKKMRVITPYEISSKYEVRISLAKDFLEELERKGYIQLVSKNKDLRIYVPK